MATTKKFRGVYGFPVTPTRDDGETVDEERLRAHLDDLIARGVKGVAVLGSTGAIGSFSEDERRRITTTTVRHVNGRVPVIIGTGALTTREAVRLSKVAEDAGADGVLVVPITYWPLTEQEVYEHYAAIAAAISLPVVVYNNPWTTGTDIKPPTLARLAEIENIRYVKESSGDVTRVTSIARLTKGSMTVFNGWEPSAFETFMAGADGWFAGMTNVIARECVQLFDLAVEKRDVLGARELFRRMHPLCEFVAEKSHVRVAHTALDLMGRPVGPPRRPLRMLGPEDRGRLERILLDNDLMDRK
jgi:4-hydroxy-tetrahydrodipicolinate synthase